MSASSQTEQRSAAPSALAGSASESTGLGRVTLKLPQRSELLELQFAKSATGEAAVWLPLDSTTSDVVVLQRRSEVDELRDVSAAPGQFALVLIPASADGDWEFIQRAQDWLDRTMSVQDAPAQTVLLSLQGAHILWRGDRIIVVAAPDRAASIARSMTAAVYCERELKAVERAVQAAWDQVQSDSPLAFEFTDRDTQRRGELARRFQDLVARRIQLSRLSSFVLTPHVHPPTLASQVGERFRERLRMPERLELVDHKLEVQEQIYEMCSHRASEFVHAQTGHRLEWFIIILLLGQTVLSIMELLARQSTS